VAEEVEGAKGLGEREGEGVTFEGEVVEVREGLE
jgi:hypothetical protein